MNGKQVVLIHTLAPLLDVFGELGAKLLPGVQINHVVDEPLLERVRQRGQLAPEDSDRLQTHVAVAEQTGADVVLVTCSTISPLADVQPLSAASPCTSVGK